MTRARHWTTLLLAAGCVLALASGLAACGGPADGALPPPESPLSPAATPEPVEPPAPATPVETPPPPTTPPEAIIPEPPAEPVAPGESFPPATERPAPEPVPRSFRYDTYDRGGTVAEPGHYAFLADPSDPASVVTTYEGLRDGTATALRIHTHDARGVSQADLYDAVEVGDLVEWRQADDCFVRYQVTAVSEPLAAAVARSFGVAWMTYAFTGCSGPIAGDTAATFEWGDLPDLGGTSLTTPIRHGPYQIKPAGWTGATEEYVILQPPDQRTYDTVIVTESLAEARRLPHWREPALPDGFLFWRATCCGDDTPYGYEASFGGPLGGLGLLIEGTYVGVRGYPELATWQYTNGRGVWETRVIAGRPAIVSYSPAGPENNRHFPVAVWVYDPATESEYLIRPMTGGLVGADVDPVIAIAASLFEPPNAP